MIRIAFLLYLAVQAISLPIGLDHPKNEVASDSVDVRVYYESLCPSSEEFLLQLASQAPSLAPIVSLSIFPYGNAHPSQSASNCTSCSSCNIWECNVTCQHGTQECKLNLAQACLLNFLPAITALPAIKCMEHLKIAPGWCISHHAPDGAKVAAEVAKCMRSPLGRTVQDYMATETLQRLSPPKQFVPWVTVDGVPLLEDYGRLVAFVCKAYKERGASILPSICAQPAIGNVNRGGAPAVCKRDEILGNQTVIYSRCRILPILGTVCVSVVEDSSSGAALSLGVVLDFKRPGLRIELPMVSSVACVSDRDLLELMLLVPELKPFDAAIRKLIKERGKIPAEVFSECLALTNVTGAGRNLTGCVALESRLMCFAGRCVYRATDSFGCFHRS